MDINELEAYIGTLTAEQAAELGIKVVDGVIVYTYEIAYALSAKMWSVFPVYSRIFVP